MRKLLVVLMCAVGLYASEVSIGQSDFLVRLINFVLFFGLLYYFLGSTIKSIFVNRREGIQKRLMEAQEQLLLIKNEKEQALKALEESKKLALEIENNAKKEVLEIGQRYEEKLTKDTQQFNLLNQNIYEAYRRKLMLNEVNCLLEEVEQKVQIKDLAHLGLEALQNGGKN
ncbi:hypothetical protein BBW65_06430 [Helicobacter enhydrae]|uniref:ATPase subunit I n=1 Tax=Helicobacter enhydrae TaxID=222136 RepID=A0A1B1U6N3_9HELI|nr:hypothetical protein [Helicobacter enhydrae]ANV98453.1 hypothetical protein BBW65_06430 [Helicobacter enhydrae]